MLRPSGSCGPIPIVVANLTGLGMQPMAIGPEKLEQAGLEQAE